MPFDAGMRKAIYDAASDGKTMTVKRIESVLQRDFFIAHPHVRGTSNPKAMSSNRNIIFSCSYHVVFCPKYRRPVLVDGVDERFKEIAREVADELGFEIVEMEVMPDHVHLLLSADPQLSIHRAIKRIKGRSSHDLRAEFPWLKSRIPTLWTNSYFVSTVGGVSLAQVRKYIERQKEV